MERREIEIFIACLAVAGLKEVEVPARVFYLIGKSELAQGHDVTGNYIDAGATRIRPIYKRPSQTFNDQDEIVAFMDAIRKEV
jgi:hypothetical protein